MNEGPTTVPIAPEDLIPDLSESERAQLARLFEVSEDAEQKLQAIRLMHHALARQLCALCPAGEQRDKAIEHLVEASRAAQASLL